MESRILQSFECRGFDACYLAVFESKQTAFVTDPDRSGILFTKPVGASLRQFGDVLKLTIMVKMPVGYDPDHGDWWYGMSSADGVRLSRRGKLTDCIACHQQAAETDYLFSREVMSAATN